MTGDGRRIRLVDLGILTVLGLPLLICMLIGIKTGRTVYGLVGGIIAVASLYALAGLVSRVMCRRIEKQESEE